MQQLISESHLSMLEINPMDFIFKTPLKKRWLSVLPVIDLLLVKKSSKTEAGSASNTNSVRLNQIDIHGRLPIYLLFLRAS